jgi:hypothetical protein
MRWPWETREDSIAVGLELSLWRDSLNGLLVIRNANYPLETNLSLSAQDTLRRSARVDSIIKVAYLRGFSYHITERPLKTEYLFGRKNDSLEMRDTFCYVTYNDSGDVIAVVEVDSVWIIKFLPDTVVDTTVVPPETTISYRVSQIRKDYYSPREAEWYYSLRTKRFIELRKRNGEMKYDLKYLTGFGSYLPDNCLAPTISTLIIKKPSGEADTFRYSPQANRQGIMNLFKIDSLYSYRLGDSLELEINLSGTDNYYLFVSHGKTEVWNKKYVPVSNNQARTKIAFSNLGFNHLFIEVLSESGLGYFTSPWRKTIWALPVKVIE